MNEVHTLLARCRELGAELTPTPHGTLKVRSSMPLPEALREALRRHKPEVLRLLARAVSFPCPSCGSVVCLDPLDAAILPTRLWACSQCSTWGTTREGAAYPVAWVGRLTMQ
jgi:predicted RNA-binding Zn-ribbon protein involved in translation (DUF1610 family)